MWWKRGLAGLASGAIAASSVYLYRDYSAKQRLPFPELQASALPRDPFFLLLSERGQPDSPLVTQLRAAVNKPVYCLDKDQFPTDSPLGLTKDAEVYFVKHVGDKVVSTPLDSYLNEKLHKWVDMHQTLIKPIQSRSQFEDTLKNRKKSAFMDSHVIAYVPTESAMQSYREVVDKVMYEDPTSHVLASSAKRHVYFYYTDSAEVAKQLGIETKGLLALYRYRDARGLFDIKAPKTTYTTPSEFTQYAETHLKHVFKISVHQLQIDLHTYRDLYTLYPHGSSAPLAKAETRTTTASELASAVANVDPLICPVWSLKDLQMMFGKLTRYLLTHPNGKLLVVSVNNDRDEVNHNDLPSLLRNMQLEELAREHPDMLVLMGTPQMLYHLPLRDFALFHFQDMEVRLIQLEGAKVQQSAYYDTSLPLREWIDKPEWSRESAPIYEESYSKAMMAEEFKQEVLDGDKCYFMMFCSVTCGSCHYQMPYFEEAAKTNSTPCTFGKYNIANQSPYFRGPNATPTYLLYTPKNKANPAHYEPKKHGLTPAAMHTFIQEHLDS